MIGAASGHVSGVATVTGWWAKDAERREDVLNDLLVTTELVAVDLEAAARRILAQYGILPAHEASVRNTLVNGGTGIMLDLLIGAAVTAYNNANAALGAGDSNAAFSLTQTNLQGAVNVTDRVRKAMAATFPSRVNNVVTFQSTFATTDANFTWNEWAIFNNVTDGSGTMLNRGVGNLGTKTSAQSWVLTATLTQN